MKRDSRTGLHRRLLENLRDNATDRCEQEARIPARLFTCAGQYSRERQALFLDTPQPVAFSGELAEPGSYLALPVLDVPVLLARDGEGTLRAFVNACAHRGAPVAEGHGRARSLVCPFHGWAYHLDGTLRGRPEDDSFVTPPGECGLTPLAVSERHGIVTVSVDPAAHSSAAEGALADIGEELAGFGFSEYRPLARRQFTVQANWKLVNDLSLESYHFKTLHRDSVAQVLSPCAVVDTFERHSRWAFPLKSIDTLADLPEAQWPDTLQGSCTYTLYPGVMLLVNALGAQMIRAEPGRHAGESVVSYVGMYAPGCDPEAARHAFEFGGEVFANEDLPMAEACQRGLAARGGELVLGRNEPLLQFWHRLWEAALADVTD